MKQYREITGKDWINTILNLFLFTALLIVGAMTLIPRRWPLGLIIWLVVIVGGGTFSFIRWHVRNFAYKCPNCGHEFEINVSRNFLSLNVFTKKYMRCPKCNQWAWMKTLKKV